MKRIALVAFVALAVVSFPDFATAYYLTGGAPPLNAPMAGEPAGDFAIGTFTYSTTDLTLSGSMPIRLGRTYRTEYKDGSGHFIVGAFGPGFNLNYQMFLYSASEVAPQANWWNNAVQIILPNGAAVTCNSNGTYSSYTLASWSCTSNPGAYYGATINYNPAIGNGAGWEVVLGNGLAYEYGLGAPLQFVIDRNGNSLTFTYSSGQSGNLTKISSSSGRWINLTYNSSNEISQAQDDKSNTYTYGYDTNNPPRLKTVTDATSTQIQSITWKTGNQVGDVASATDGDNNTGNFSYDTSFRITQGTGPNGGYTASYNGAATTITDPNGNKTVYNFTNGYLSSMTAASGTSIAQPTSYARDSANRISSVTDAANRTTSFTYTSLGHIQTVTLPAQNQSCTSLTAPVWTYTYTNNPPFHQLFTHGQEPFEVLQTVSDPLNHVSFNVPSGQFDSHGNPLQVQNGNGSTWTYTFTGVGQVHTASDPLSPADVETFAYNAAGDLTSYINPNQHQWTVGSDYMSSTNPGVGNTTSVTTPLSEAYTYVYDADRRLTSAQDPIGANNSKSVLYTYDGNSNLASVKDENGNTTTFTLNLGGILETVCHPWDSGNFCTNYTYDSGGRLSGLGYPNNLGNSYTYDALNRLTKIVYNSGNISAYNQSSTTFKYNTSNQLTQTVDTYAGTTNRSYDNLNELSSETWTATSGTITSSSAAYCYDKAGRRTSTTISAMQNAIQLTSQSVSYGYDSANNLLSTSGSSNTQLAYDAAGRRIAAFMPNNVTEYYFYDPASNLKWIEEYYGGSSTGKYLQYAYDSDERRNLMSGPLAAVNMPPIPWSATYGVGNQMTKWNGTTITYDALGNMKNDPSIGATSMGFDERNHLFQAWFGNQGLPPMYGFIYDDLGRRRYWSGGPTSPWNQISETYLEDGQNVAFVAGTGTGHSYNVFQGLGLDDYFSIAVDGNAAQTVQHDGLGSTTGSVNSSGTTTGNYHYAPFGATTSSGSPGAGPFQYTGRELDPTGLYYMRNRYYSPGLQRFISPDPSGFGGGDTNLYAYVHDSPVDLTDSLGLSPGARTAGPPGSTGQFLHQGGRMAQMAADIGTSSTISSAFSQEDAGLLAAMGYGPGFIGGFEFATAGFSPSGYSGEGVTSVGFLPFPTPFPKWGPRIYREVGGVALGATIGAILGSPGGPLGAAGGAAVGALAGAAFAAVLARLEGPQALGPQILGGIGGAATGLIVGDVFGGGPIGGAVGAGVGIGAGLGADALGDHGP